MDRPRQRWNLIMIQRRNHQQKLSI
uniref:Uncharacterized protein n=1 Tax=Romanomermis culicivorax TaxID=13658 RepID=A0A915J2R6_ROMCU